MDDAREQDVQLRFLQKLVDQRAKVAGDIIAIDTQTWAIHGTILVDGDVLMAEYHDQYEARAALEQLRPDQPGG